MSDRVKITDARTHRAKSRLREHGNIFEKVTTEGSYGVLCRAVDGSDWLGWFFDDEASWTIFQLDESTLLQEAQHHAADE